MSNIQLLLVAAGRSKRMKEPKQLMPWGTKTLIEHQISTLLKTYKSLSVVLGAYAESIKPVIEPLPIQIVFNENWERGMGTSIAKGVEFIIAQHPLTDGILISLVDQPLVTTGHFVKMLESFQPGEKRIIASETRGSWTGAPVIFDKYYFEELVALDGDQGAKKVTNQNKSFVTSVDGTGLLVDVDTPTAYAVLLNQYLTKDK